MNHQMESESPSIRVKRTIHTGMVVSDIDRSIAFFRDVFNFEVSSKMHHQGSHVGDLMGVPGAEVYIAFVTLPGHELELLQFVVPDSVHTPAPRAVDPGSTHLTFEVDDVDQALVAMKTGGFLPIGKPQSPQAGPRKGGRIVYTCGPDGILIELVQMPNRLTQGQQNDMTGTA